MTDVSTSEGVAADELKQFIERIERLESARWRVAARRAVKARKALAPVSDAYWSACCTVDPTTMSRRAWSALQKDREAKRLAYEAAKRRARRAEAAEETGPGKRARPANDRLGPA